jgi:hypothetical protein
MSLGLDHRTGFVDGASTLEMILDMSGMMPSDVLRTFVIYTNAGS